MKKYYTVGNLKTLNKINLKKVRNDIDFPLPTEYVDFLMSYGFGDISGLLMITSPDKEQFCSTFQDHMDLWELTEIKKEKVLDGVTIAKTIDGDIVLLISDNMYPYVIMPRHSEKPIYFREFNQIIEYYKSDYKLNDNQFYFDSYYNYEIKSFMNFIRNGIFDKSLFEEIHTQFIKDVSFDKVIDNKQPKYIIQKIGGWVYFDTIGKSSIRIKYQKQFKDEANNVIEFINAKLKTVANNV